MFQKSFCFTKAKTIGQDILITPDTLYDTDRGYGFVTEHNRSQLECLQIPELNSGFSPWYWLSGQELTRLSLKSHGICLDSTEPLPLIFKADVPSQGNYQIRLGIQGGTEGIQNLMIFSGRRRLTAKGICIAPGEIREETFTVNICDIIPRGLTKVRTDTSFDLALFGSRPAISHLVIEEIQSPTLYIAGDSTVTDQSGSYPYQPECCYSGWGQMLSAFLRPGIALSNHAHSGLTTESFRKEGHYEIVKKYIAPGDFYLMQFAHNDQKLPHLGASDGYRQNLVTYINEIRSLHAFPILVTPLARNTWKGDGSYNDLLKDYAEECIRLGAEMDVPVLDLHKRSMDFIIKEGLESSKRYFYPGDYTHTNDYGAYLMAGHIAQECLKIPMLQKYIQKQEEQWLPPLAVRLPKPPEGYQTEADSPLPAIESLKDPERSISRVEALDYVIKTIGFVPMNVYNDHYPDVVGHEWYAGTVESAVQNDLADSALTADGKFHPLEPVTWEQLISFSMNGYKCRKAAPALPKGSPGCPQASGYAKEAVRLASHLGLLPETPDLNVQVTQKEAIQFLQKLSKLLLPV